MIDAAQFVDAARERGFDWYAGVPCSFLTPFINYVLQAPSLHYLSAANEGDAVGLIAGATLAGRRGVTMMQNSGLGNAVSPLTSLTWTFRLPQLLVITWRGQPGVADEPQHALMGPITPVMLQTMEIPWETFPTDAGSIRVALDRAIAHMDATGRPYALVMQKGSVAPYPLRGATARARRAAVPIESMLRGVTREGLPSRSDVLRAVIDATPVQGSVVLASTGFCGRELYALHDRPNQLYMVGSMGCVMTIALGLALARPDLRVVALDGDGAALMRMGAFATLGAYGASNLVHIVLDNGVHDSTGGQASVSPGMSFAGVAAACGYGLVIDGDDLGVLRRVFNAEPLGDGPRFACIKIRPGSPENLPRPCVTPEQVKERLMNHIAQCAGGR